MDFSKIALNYKNILLKHKKCIVNSRSECDISTTIASKSIKCPVIPSNMPAITNIDICKLFDQNDWFHIYPRTGGICDIQSYITKANYEKWRFVSISIGIKEDDMEMLRRIKNSKLRVDSICIDIAFSYTDRVIPFIKYIKENLPETYLIVGNGDSGEWVNFLEDLEVDCVKMFLGVSSACRTKQFTSVGSSTITDLIECSNSVSSASILCDGGLTIENGEVWIGDVVKSIRFGADFCLSGSLFSKCIDSPAIKNGYFGNSTHFAKGHKNNVEGANVMVETNGLTILETMKLIEDSLKSATSYLGKNKLKDIIDCEYQIVF